MPLPETVSLHVPYTDNEQQFLLSAVKTAMRTFRSMTLDRAQGQVFSSPASSSESEADPRQ